MCQRIGSLYDFSPQFNSLTIHEARNFMDGQMHQRYVNAIPQGNDETDASAERVNPKKKGSMAIR